MKVSNEKNIDFPIFFMLINYNKYLQAIKSIEVCLYKVLIIIVKDKKQLNFQFKKLYFVLQQVIA